MGGCLKAADSGLKKQCCLQENAQWGHFPMTRVCNDGFAPDRTTQIGLANTKWEKKYLTGQAGWSVQTSAKNSSASSLVE